MIQRLADLGFGAGMPQRAGGISSILGDEGKLPGHYALCEKIPFRKQFPRIHD